MTAGRDPLIGFRRERCVKTGEPCECFKGSMAEAYCLAEAELRGERVTPFVSDPDFTLYVGDVSDVLAGMPDESVHCVVTSPPYWGLRDYGVDGQLGLEPTPEEYVARMVDVFREVRRVLRRDGTCWLNIGDSYAMSTRGAGGDGKQHTNAGSVVSDRSWQVPASLKPKDLVGIPWKLAFALQADGWYLRADIIWSKPNPMPESVTDRPTKAHEYLFLLARSPRYFYDADAIREDAEYGRRSNFRGGGAYLHTNGSNAIKPEASSTTKGGGNDPLADHPTIGDMPPEAPRGPDGRRATHVIARDGSAQHRDGDRWPNGPNRNKRSVWEIATAPYAEAHFATFPPALVEPCVKAGTSERGCCPECGAPWERVTSARGQGDAFKGEARDTGRPDGAERRNPRGGQKEWNSYTPPETIGWRRTCDHGKPPVPCVVLDPFMGSGTTALVARRLGRRSIGVELNDEYARLAARRLSQLSLLAEGAA